MISAFAAPKWPGDYGKEKEQFYHTWLLITLEKKGAKMILTPWQDAALNA